MGWYEAIKDAISTADKLRDAELKENLANVRMEGAKLAEENARLREELIEIREKLKIRDVMEFRHDVYWRRLPGGADEGPYCPKCRDGEGKLARMGDRPHDKYWRCRTCDLVVLKRGGDARLP